MPRSWPIPPSFGSASTTDRYRDLDPTDEPYFRELWGLDNTGQRLYQGDVGDRGAWRTSTSMPSRRCASRPETRAWWSPSSTTGSTSATRTSPARAWTNPGEWGGGKDTNGVDDDGNGYIDDVHGWDFCHDDNTVHDSDDDFHGTHVAGTIAASLDGHGVVGVAPSIRIMALKFIDDEQRLRLGPPGRRGHRLRRVVRRADRQRLMGPRRGPDRGLGALPRDRRHSSSMLFVASAGNTTHNNDGPSPAVPASYDLPNILSIAALDNDGRHRGFLQLRRASVDIAAPGVAILSTLPADSIDPQPGWGWLNGTSMAAPHVTGVAALIASYAPGLAADPAALRARLMATGKAMPATVGLTVTGRTVDAYRALDTLGPIAQPPSGATFIRGRSSARRRYRPGRLAGRDRRPDRDQRVRLGLKIDGGTWQTFVSSTKARTADRLLTFGTRTRSASGPATAPRTGDRWQSARSSCRSSSRRRART